MNISTKITAALFALGIISRASATDPVVYLTGSTAFRSTVYVALSNNTGTNNGGVFDAGTVTQVTYGNSNPGAANYMVFHGTIQGSPVYVDCAWSGSEAGIASVCQTTLQNTDRNGNPIPLAGSPETWLAVTNVTLDGTIYANNPASSLLEPNSHGADLAQADTSQAVSWTPFVANTPSAVSDYGVEGIVTFTWSKNINSGPSQSWSDLKNVTIPQLAVLLADGSEPAAFFTGVASETNQFVYCIGRNKGSGTRMNTLADTGYGTKKSVTQFSIGEGIEDPTVNTTTLDIENNNGYESGGGVAHALSLDGSCQITDPFTGNSGWLALGYASPSDLLSANVGTNNWVTVDGVMESNGAIEEGQYWYWGHEHLYGKYGITGIQDTVGHAIYNAVVKTLAVKGFGAVPGNHDPGIALQFMHAQKISDVSYPIRQ